MILTLTIKNLAVIQDVTLNLDSSFLALLGETGSGKSLTVDALALLLGQRFDKSLLRDGADRCEISALFCEDSNGSQAKGLFDENGELTLRRVFDKDGGSRQWINAHMVSLREYRESVRGLMDIHRQGQNAELLEDSSALEYVDRIGGKELLRCREKYQKAFQDYHRKIEEWTQIQEANKEMDADYLDFQISEIQRYDLKEGEIERLEESLQSLKDVERIEKTFERFHEQCRLEEGNLADLIQDALDCLRPLSETTLADLSQSVQEDGRKFLQQLRELEWGVQELHEKTEEIDRMNARLFELKSLQRKYGKTTKDILSALERFQRQKALLEDYEAEVSRAKAAVEEALELVLQNGRALSLLRQQSADSLKAKVNAEMKDLGLPDGGFDIRLQQSDPSEEGLDTCQFYVQLNKGLSSHELSKVVSGGEGARLMLAIKAVLNHIAPTSLLVLDEIDTGVSGRMAGLMAMKIREISKDSQVLVISHLPQVVSMARTHVCVSKEVADGKTIARFRTLSPEEVVEEIAKMISGRKKTETALLQARELFREGQR